MVALENSLSRPFALSFADYKKDFRKLKRDGLGDRQIADAMGAEPMEVREARKEAWE